MPKASEVGAALRHIAEGFDKNPDAEVACPSLYFSHTYMEETKARKLFLALADCLPRPLAKKYGADEFRLTYESPGAEIDAYIRRTAICRLVKPAQEAVYECEPILSVEEEESIIA